MSSTVAFETRQDDHCEAPRLGGQIDNDATDAGAHTDEATAELNKELENCPW